MEYNNECNKMSKEENNKYVREKTKYLIAYCKKDKMVNMVKRKHAGKRQNGR